MIHCPRCDEVILEAQCDGLVSRLSRHSVPVADSIVLRKYTEGVWNVWMGHTQLFVISWFGPSAPEKGRLYCRHICYARE